MVDNEQVTVVVDAANCVGSVPDGWWRDRRGATERLRDGLTPESVRDALRLGCIPRIVLVVEGRARGVQPTPSVEVVEAAGSGDDAIVDVAAELAACASAVVVVTADRELRRRVTQLGADTAGPRTVRPLPIRK